MKLYEINDGIAALRDFGVDPETGEILDESDEYIEEMIEVLQLDRTEKLEGCAVLTKEFKRDIDALKSEIQRLQREVKARERRIESLQNYMTWNMEPGEKVETLKAKIGWRKSTAVVVDNIYQVPVEFYKIREPEADKTAIKDALKEGREVPGAHIEERQNISIR